MRNGDHERLALREHEMTPATAGYSIVVPNEGSTARDHLANERTFLGWIQMSVTVISLGLAIAKLMIGGQAAIFGTGIIFIGAGLLIMSSQRYFEISGAVERGQYVILKGGVTILVAVLVTVAVGCVLLVFVKMN